MKKSLKGNNAIYFSLYLLILLLLTACQHSNETALLNDALEQAGKNRGELRKVLSRYSLHTEDSLKYKAACFLIENMPYYSYYEGELLDNYLSYFSLLKENKRTTLPPAAIADTVRNRYGSYSVRSLELKNDIEELDSAYICHNIEWAFKVWEEQPWGKSVSFEDFCEYILPYRIGDEKPVYWREELYTAYNHLLEPLRDGSLSGKEDPIHAVWLLMEHITDRDDIYFTTVAPADLPHVGPAVARLKAGSCKELTDFVVYVCRSLGIPCYIDFMPIRGNDNVGHFWVSFIDKRKELYSQDFPEGVTNVRINGIKNDSKAKVYRYTFSMNQAMRKEILALESSVPELFEDTKYIDVTELYANHHMATLQIPSSDLYERKTKAKIAYLCSSQHTSWVPVAWAPFDRENLHFDSIQKEGMLRVATWENGRLRYYTDPFRIDPFTNELVFYSGNGEVRDMTLYAKFDVDSETFFTERMIGGVFEGSNQSDFFRKDTLYLINQAPERLQTQVKSWRDTKYRYIRYYGPPGGHSNISEVAFYENLQDTVPLQGIIMGPPGSFEPYDSHEYTNVYDGKTWTSFDYKEPSGGWAGLDLGQPKKISKIVYTPRNRDNYIRPGDSFELFYCDGDWKSLGVIESEGDFLDYKDVPDGVLLYLACHSRGQQERIFTYENGKQIWW